MDNRSDTEKFKAPQNGEYEFDNVPLDDPLVWSAYHRGDTIGTFQTESMLGQIWCKKIRPSNIEELSDIIALVRPGPLNSGQSDKYASIKNGKDTESYIHDSLVPVLQSTLSCLVYQEQSMKIANVIASFDDGEQNDLRKALGKKKPEMILPIHNKFVERALEIGKVNKEQAEEIFGWIEKGQRYLFNKSHSIQYATESYFSMYAKVHYPTQFYCSWLSFAQDKEEISELVQDAKLHDIEIQPPSIIAKNADFEIIEDKKIRFGINHIRGIGQSSIESIKKINNKLDNFIDLIYYTKKIKRHVVEALIKSGACDSYKINRSCMLKTIHVIFGRGAKESDITENEFKPLTDKELQSFFDNIKLGVPQALQKIIDEKGCINKRIPVIESKINFIDSISNIKEQARTRAVWERLYLGIALTCSAVDDIEKTEKNYSTCRKAHDLPKGTKTKIYAVIDKVHLKKTTEKAKVPNQPYVYLDCSDNTAALNSIVCWPDKYELFKENLVENSVVLLYIRKDRWKDRDQYIIQDITFLE